MNSHRHGRRASRSEAEKPAALFVIPCGRGQSFAWCADLDPGSLAAIGMPGAQIEIATCSRLHQPGRTLEVLTLQSTDLRDGAACTLTIEGEPHTRAAEIALARWSEPDTRRILKFIVSRLLPHDGAAPSLERYLALISAWQANGRFLASFPEGQLVEVDADLRRPEIPAYAIAGPHVSTVTARLLSFAHGRSTIWIDGAQSRQVYLDLGDDLVALEPQPADSTARSTAEILASLSEGERSKLLHALDRPSHELSPELNRWSATLARRNAAASFADARLEVLGLVRIADDQLVAILDLHGEVQQFGAIGVRGFRAAESADSTIVRWDLTPEPGAMRQQRICVRVAAVSEARCHRVTVEYDQESHERWIREMPASDTQALTLAAELWPHGAADRNLFAGVVQPIAAAQEIAADPQPLRRAAFGPRVTAVDAVVLIVADQNLEALHRTVIGLSLSAGKDRLVVQIATRRGETWDDLNRQASAWAERYGLAIQVEAYAPALPEAALLSTAAPLDALRIVCRAGAVPGTPDWLLQIVADLQEHEAALLVGTRPAADRPEPASSDFVALTRQLAEGSDLVIPQVVSMAVFAPTGEWPPGPAVHTLEGALLARACALRLNGEPVVLTAAPAFVETGAPTDLDPFALHCDRLTLQKIALHPVLSKKRIIRIEPTRTRRA